MDELFPLTPIQSQRSGGLSLSLRKTNRRNKTNSSAGGAGLNACSTLDCDIKPVHQIANKPVINPLKPGEVVQIPMANLPTVRVRSIDELKAPQSPQHSDAAAVENQPMVTSEVINISSDEDFEDSKHNIRRVSRKTSTATPRTPIRRARKKKSNTEVKLEKVTLTRKLTKSTNLKTFSSKYMPANQQSIHKYFDTLDKTDRLGYCETFEKSTVRKTPPPSPPRKKLEPINLNSKFNANNMIKPLPGKSLVDGETLENMPRLLEYIEQCARSLAAPVEPQQDSPILNSQQSSTLSAYNLSDEKMQNIAHDIELPNNDSIENQKEYVSIQSQTDTSGATVSTQKSSANFGRVRKHLSFKLSQEVTTVEDTEDAGDVIDLCDSQTPEKKVAKENGQTVVKAAARKVTNRRKKRATPIKKERRKKAECPSYKVVENTTFAVDAFRYGEIEGVTHYFLTHFHADHYIGLSKKFTKPVYLSAISARLVTKFLRTRPEYLHIINSEEPIIINGIEIVATDANHCPGAFMFIFKFSTGLCTLHTGDFRACPEMEEGPVFWNYPIDTIYLDTTYLSSRYFFKSQSESIYDAKCVIDEFREKHIGEKVLYIFGSYVIGKEKMWETIASEYGFKVWTDENRRKALEAIGNQDYLKHIVDNPHEADMHILTLGNMSYDYLNEYIKQFCEFNTIFAIRASGWEKNSKPQYRGRINIVGIAYSEHSSYDELRRFVRFLQPSKIISTVPSGSDVNKTSKIPRSWFENELKSWQKGYQSSITNYISVKDSRKNQATTSSAQAVCDENGRRDTDSSDDFMAQDCTLTTNATPGQKEVQLAEIINDWLL